VNGDGRCGWLWFDELPIDCLDYRTSSPLRWCGVVEPALQAAAQIFKIKMTVRFLRVSLHADFLDPVFWVLRLSLVGTFLSFLKWSLQADSTKSKIST
jgi:hypothetical protein